MCWNSVWIPGLTDEEKRTCNCNHCAGGNQRAAFNPVNRVYCKPSGEKLQILLKIKNESEKGHPGIRTDAGVILIGCQQEKNQQEKYFLKIALSFPKKRPINRLDSRNANHFKEERRCRYAYRSL